MKLVPKEDDAEGPGLWADPDWTPAMPATFAVIIGVSKYRHFDGGEMVAQDQGVRWVEEARALGQLYVSALTAFKAFAWLGQQYRHEAPLARCWLLLSPTREELPLMSLGDRRLRWADPTFDACQKAIRWWSSTMRGLPAATAAKSRGFFFFSGHGLESTREQQLLLPSDYLSPPEPSANDAISTRNLRLGVSSLQVGEQLFFVDACRNDHVEMRGKKFVGADILNEEETAVGSPDLVTPVLYSTGPGLRSFQRRDPAKGISIYGEALLDGLCGKPNIELKGDGPQRRIELSPLEQFVGARVLQLLKAAGSTERQLVRLGGSSSTAMNVTYVDLPVPPPTESRSAIDLALESIRADTKSFHEKSLEGVADSVNELIENMVRHPVEGPPPVFDMLAAGTPIRARGDSASAWLDPNEGHRLFGSETVTALWQERAKVWSIARKSWHGPKLIRIAEVARSEDKGRYRVRMQLTEQEPPGYWLQLIDGYGKTHACMLPVVPGIDSGRLDPIFEILFERGPGDTDRAITRLEAQLAEQGGGLGHAAMLWRRYTTEHVASAVADADSAELRNLIERKIDSPLAAVIATLVLLRANCLDRIPQGWLANLSHWYRHLPDGPVLFAERRLRERSDSQAIAEAARFLLMVRERGIPRTSEAFDYALSLVARLKDRPELAIEVRGKLQDLEQRLDRAFETYRTGGLFVSFSGLQADQDPDSLWAGPA